MVAQPGSGRRNILSDQRKLFCMEYMKDLNAKAAAIRAGYAGRSAENLMKDPLIKAEIQRQMDKRGERLHIDADRVVLELGRIGFSNPQNVFGEDGRIKELQDLDVNTAAAISSFKIIERGSGDDREVTTEVKFLDKKPALDSLAKHLGMFVNRSEVTVTHRIQELSDEELEREINGLLIEGEVVDEPDQLEQG